MPSDGILHPQEITYLGHKMLACLHCDEPALTPVYPLEDLKRQFPFCCQGCLTVFEVLKSKDLGAYYDIKKSSATIKRRSPVLIKERSYGFLDDENFIQEYTYPAGPGQRTIEFYLEGIHCLACLWLIEKLGDIIPGVISSKLDVEKAVATVVINEQGRFSLVASELDRLGYRPHALKRNEDSKALHRKEERAYLSRIGIAGAAAGNIMIYAVSLYGGAADEMGELFNLLTVILAIPVFTYSAWPFYESAWNSIKNKTVSIDIPISMALILGVGMGVWDLIYTHKENYFDSLTALVFLLLLSRYFLRKIQEKGLNAQDLHYFYSTESVQRLNSATNKFDTIHARFIRVGDVLKIGREDFIPADGVVTSGEGLINNSLLTGESMPDRVKVGHPVFSGTQNLTSEFEMKVEKIDDQTRLGTILKNVENGWALRSRTVDVTAVVAKYFTIAVCLLAVILFVVGLEDGASVALTRAITLLIVTCPCALALSVPLTFNRTLSLAAEKGLIIKSDEVIEKAAKIKSIFLDKTGTITLGQLQVENLSISSTPSTRIEEIIFALEKYSHHPVGKALVRSIDKSQLSKEEAQDWMEIPGRGVQGKLNNHFYEIRDNQIFEDGNSMASFEIRDGLRPDSMTSISELKKKNLVPVILSGDKSTVAIDMGEQVGLKALGALSPEQKVEIVRSTPDSIMVGDGANDALALEAASVGVAVSGAMDIALRAADVYMTVPGLAGVNKLVTMSKETMKVIHRNLIISLLYNSVSVVLVFTGKISPLTAAIVMPVSSLTVFLSGLAGTKTLRDLWKS